jgi:hypothetical protein
VRAPVLAQIFARLRGKSQGRSAQQAEYDGGGGKDDLAHVPASAFNSPLPGSMQDNLIPGVACNLRHSENP